ncbi:substrate-binding domain-containing protein [Kitasatospora sp. NPDC002551]|uniref:PstS family phosphate ABC transporter substrate-binding protein n=1 Tax=unclassified Kitasatospora TaxID=2633591 RepID=UPI003328CE9C
MRKTMGKPLTVAALAASLVGLTGGAALADPPVVPNPGDIVGVGSQTTAPLFNQLSTDYNAALTAAGDTTSPRLYSFDAIGPSPIVLKAGSGPVARPTGSGAGLGALHAVPSQVDFVRMDRGRLPTDLASDTFVALAKDAVSWAAQLGGHAPANLTTAQLKDVYTCVRTTWQQLDPSLPNATIKPFLPQSGSGLRDFFLKALGGGTPIIPGACVTSGVQDNQGTDPVLHDADALVPYSVGHYVGQAFFGRSTGSDAPGTLTVRGVNGIAAVNTANQSINSPFAASTYGRVLHNVVRGAEWTATDAHGAALRNIFAPNGFICRSATAIADLKSHGFLPLPGGACGSTS